MLRSHHPRMQSDEPRLLAVVRDPMAIERLEVELIDLEVHWQFTREASAAATSLVNDPPDLVLVDLLVDDPELSLVRKIRSLTPNTPVLAVAAPNQPELTELARSLGVQAVLRSVSDPELRAQLLRLRGKPPVSRDPAALADLSELAGLSAELLSLADEGTRHGLAERLAELLSRRLEARSVAVYLSADESSRHLMRVATWNPSGTEPSFGDELEILRYASTNTLETIRLAVKREQFGLLLVGGLPKTRRTPPMLSIGSSLASLVLGFVLARERSTREAIKDSESGAYTLAYFIDVARREIEIARRSGGGFAVATVLLGGSTGGSSSPPEPSTEILERLRPALRSMDVLARVGTREIYVLLPRTPGLAAQVCRRRIHSLLRAATPIDRGSAVMGFAVFPYDGRDLSQLLRVAKSRADASQQSFLARFHLDRLPLPELLETLLGTVALQASRIGDNLEAPRYIELPMMDAIELALATVREATRTGDARVLATQGAAAGLGGALGSEIQREVEGARVQMLDADQVPGLGDTDILVIETDHLAYALVGRSRGGLLRAIHTCDPMLTDALMMRFSDPACSGFEES